MGGLNLDFSIRTAPSTWVDSETQPADQDYTPKSGKRNAPKVHLGQKRADVFTGSVLMTLVSALVASIWYAGQLQETSALAAWAIPIGLLYALVMRLGAGSGDPDMRSMVCAVFYAATVFGVTYFVTRDEFRTVYGYEPAPGDIDHWLMRSRFDEPTVILSWVGGFWATIHMSYLLAARKRRKRL